MTPITSLTGKTIPLHIVVLVRQIPGIVVLVAVNATELGKIPRRRVTFHAVVPLPFVFSAENGKIQFIVL